MKPLDAVIPRELLNEPPDPIRGQMDDEKMEELVRSMKDHGQLFPLLVFPVEADRFANIEGCIDAKLASYKGAGGRFEIIDGHRRYIASGRCGFSALDCKVYQDAEEAKFGMMLDANYIREDVTPAEEGLLFLELTDKRGWSLDQLCSKFHKSPNYIQDRVDIVQKDQGVCQAVADRKLSISQAKVILKQKNPSYRAYLLEQAVTHGATVRTLTYINDQWKAEEIMASGAPHPQAPVDSTPPPVAEVPKCIFCDSNDAPQHLQDAKIHWYHRKDLDAILRQIRSHPIVTP